MSDGIGRRLRYEVLRRDSFTCRYCGATAPQVKLTVDHVVPVSLGGQDVPENLVTACFDCNAGKSSVPPEHRTVADVSEDAFRWAAAMRSAAAMMAVKAQARADFIEDFDGVWRDWSYNDTGAPVTRPSNWPAIVGKWHDAGVDIDALEQLIDDVLGRPVEDTRMWRYFCGAVRNLQAEQTRLAGEIVAQGVAR